MGISENREKTPDHPHLAPVNHNRPTENIDRPATKVTFKRLLYGIFGFVGAAGGICTFLNEHWDDLGNACRYIRGLF